MLIDRVAENLKAKCGIKIQEKIVLGFSGGADSVFLLDILYKLGYKVVVAYFNHQLRLSAAEEVQFAKKIVEKYKYVLILGGEDIKIFAKKTNRGIEETARFFRYKFLMKAAQDTISSSVAVAHHADDQIETILMNLIRGTGLNGLIGMDYVSYSEFNKTIPIIRPLLDVWKDEIVSYCEDNNLAFTIDETNADEVFTRNSIRASLIPFLEKYNPNFKQGLTRMSGILHDDHAFLTQYSKKITEKIIHTQENNFVEINILILMQYPISVQRYVINGILQNNFKIGKKKSFNLIENIRKVFTREISSHYSRILKDLHVIVEKDQGYLLTNMDDLENKVGVKLEDGMTEVTIPGLTPVNQNWCLKSAILSFDKVRKIFKKNENNYSAYLDAELAEGKIIMRKWQAGDRYTPLGLSGQSMKLSDFWINKDFPKRLRANWPLVVSNRQLIWIPGFQPAFKVRITESTKHVLQLNLEEY